MTPSPQRADAVRRSPHRGTRHRAANPNFDMPSTPTIHEPARDTSIVERVEVVVAGGGPAGVAAALGAARAQRALGREPSVRLIECHGQLGGIWTTGLLSWVLDAGNKGGVMAEVFHRLDALAGRKPPDGHANSGVAYDPERMKLVLERMCVEAGVSVRLHTTVVAAVREGTRIAALITESKSGREAFAADVFIDATGDGDLSALAGCGFDFGRPADGPGSEGPDRAGETQPMTLMMLVTGIDAHATAEFHERKDRPWSAPKDALFAEFARAGVTPSYGKPTIFVIAPDLYAWMINHEYGYDGRNAQHLTDATLHARDELHRHVDALRALGGPWSNIRIVATAAQIGVREGRRIRGRYTVTLDDMLEGRTHPDAVCRVTFGIDVHSTHKQRSGTAIESSPGKGKTRPYDVPYAALVAADVDNLLLAGRCISGDFLAHSSYRVTGNSVAMGEAAGAAAALAAARGVSPHTLDYAAEVRPLQRLPLPAPSPPGRGPG